MQEISRCARRAFAMSRPWFRRFCGGVFIALTCVALNTAQAQITNCALGTTALVEGPAAGNDSVVLAVSPATGFWTATASTNWLHLSPANQSGTGSTNVVFSFDANSGGTRSGTLTIAGQTLAVTQAGSTYVLAGLVATIASAGIQGADGVAVDSAGNVYFAGGDNSAVMKWTAANNTVTTLVSSGLDWPHGVAVDSAGNVYIADSDNNAIKKWTAANSDVTTLVSSGLNFPVSVALDGAGNVYIADTDNNAIKEWTVANSNVTTLVSSGVLEPYGVAVDRAGNVYIADTDNNAIKEWSVANSNVTTLVSGLNSPFGLAVDGAGNVYFNNYAPGSDIMKWTASDNTVTTLVPGSYEADVVAVDGAGNIYVAQSGGGAILELPFAFVDPTGRTEGVASGNDSLPSVLPVTANLLAPFAPASDQSWLTISGITDGVVSFSFAPIAGPTRTANITLLGQTVPVTQVAVATYSLDMTALVEGPNAGSVTVVLTVSPNIGPWTASANAAWLHLTAANESGVGSTNVVFSYDSNPGATRSGTIAIAGQTLTVTQSGAPYFLGTNALLEGPIAGSDSVVLPGVPNSNAWTATANAAWLHLDVANQAGTSSTNVVFSYDSNPGATRSGTLTIAGLTLFVIQAGSTYVAAQPVTTLMATGHGVAVDGRGNVYTGISGSNPDYSYTGDIYGWAASNNTVSKLVASAQYRPLGVAVDGVGNVYFTSGYPAASAIYEWTAANETVTPLVSSGLSQPQGVAVDGVGNVYITDTDDKAIKEWNVASSYVTTLVSVGLNQPNGVAVDGAGNVYIADTGNNAIEEWTPGNNTMTTLISNLNLPHDVAVDGSGNVYIADAGDNAIKKWTAASQTMTTLVSSPLISLGLNQPFGVAVDGSGNLYIADAGNGVIKELPHAFVDPTDRLEHLAAGSDSLPVVLPAAENLLAPFAPYTDNPWLTISGISNGVVTFSFTASSSNRTGNIILLGQTIPVTQGGPSYSLGTKALLVGPTTGFNSVVFSVAPRTGTWAATANASWLHLSLANQGGSGSTNVVFSYDANQGTTRSGTLTIGGQTLTVTQAGSNYISTGAVTTLASWGGLLPGYAPPNGVAVDGSGNVYAGRVYYADYYSYGALFKWSAISNTATTLVTQHGGTDSYSPSGVTVDWAGNVYFTSGYPAASAIYEWTAANETVTLLVSSGLSQPQGLAVDGVGNVYIADTGDNAIKEWAVAGSNLTTLASIGLNQPLGVAVDGSGNVYIADTGDNAIKKWTSANNTMTTLVSSNLKSPQGVAVDGSGNVYIADTGGNAIKKWTAANGTVTTLIPSGLSSPGSVAVDGTGNVYVADYGHNAIEEMPYAFVDPTPKLEGLAAGNDALPVVLPTTENLLPPFAPTSSDTNWLTITGITNGVVSFSVTANSGPARTAHIALLGQSIPITQGVIGTAPTLTGLKMLGSGACQFYFSNTASASFTVFSTTNLSLPVTDWKVAGAVAEIAPGEFQFVSQPATNDPVRFYTVRTP